MLQVNNVSLAYGDQRILQNIDLKIERQEIHVFMGLNGSGKSTLLKSLVGIVPVQTGEIFLKNQNIKSLNFKERSRKISFLESQNQVVFSMTVRELLELSMRLHDDENIYNVAIEALDLKSFENKNLLHLSSGEMKRAFIAHALCTKAEIILLDEPLAHLDWRHQATLVKAIKSWRECFNTTFVLAIHELEWIPKLADQVTALGRGRVLKRGTASEVIQSLEVGEVFAFSARIDENPIDGTRRLTLGQKEL